MKTIEQVIAEEAVARAEFEAATVAFEAHGAPVTMAQARAVFDRYHSGPWKAPVDARHVPYADAAVFAKAVEFYQGCTARMVPEKSGSGAERGYRVTSVGYVC